VWADKFKKAISLKHEQSIPFVQLPNIAQNRKKILKLLSKNSTPLFIADKQIFLDRLEKLKTALSTYWGNSQVAYSFKTNYEIAKLNIFKKHKCWAEVVSGQEYSLAKKLGYKGTQIIFNGPHKKDSKLSLALKDGALVNIDNFDELERIIKIAKTKRGQWNIGIRINAKIPYVEKSRFGFSIDNDEAKSAIEKLKAARNLELTSFHSHIGSDIDNLSSYQVAAESLCNLIKNNIPDYQGSIESLDFGGGFPAHGKAPFGKKKWSPQPIEKYIEVITQPLGKTFTRKNKPLLILEPGRYLVDNAVVFITKVVVTKYTQETQTVTVDATATMLPLIYYRPQIVKIFNKSLEEKRANVINSIVYGASCREEDLLYKNSLPKVRVGDLIVFFVVGAYNQTMSAEFIFKKPKTIFI